VHAGIAARNIKQATCKVACNTGRKDLVEKEGIGIGFGFPSIGFIKTGIDPLKRGTIFFNRSS